MRKLLLVGLDNSGKSTLLRRQNKNDLQQGQAELISTTSFMSVEKVTLPFSQQQCLVYDMSGQVSNHSFELDCIGYLLVLLCRQGRYREAWSFFYPEVDGIFFVVDAGDFERLSVAQEVL